MMITPRNFFRAAVGLLGISWFGCAASAAEEAARALPFRETSVQNTQPRRDIAGEVIDAHDGCLQFFDGRYYLYGTAYGKSAGFGINNRFRVYSSADLERWQFEGELLKEPPRGVFYRPYVVYNPNTKKYVAWFNWYPKLWDGHTGAAVSDTPVGPFTIVEPSVKLSQGMSKPGDGSLFVDHDGTGYFIYTAIEQGHAIRVEKLTPDFVSSTGETSGVLAKRCEAPALFRRGHLYYALFDSNCCFCQEGSGARVYVATAPLEPYTLRGDINWDAEGRIIIPGQQTFIARIPTVDGDAFIWMADEWGSRRDGIKGSDLQFWSPPLRFTAEGDIETLENVLSWKATIRVGEERAPTPQPYVWPRQKDPNPIKVHPCTNKPIPPEEWDTGE